MTRVARPRHRGQQGTPAKRDAVLAELIRQTWLIYRVLARCGIPPRDREELAQDVLLHALSMLRDRPFIVPPERSLESAVGGWLTSLATMRCCNFRSRVRRVVLEIESVEVLDDSPGPDDRAASRALVGALDRLTSRDHRLLTMVGLGFTAEEIAEQIGIDASAVKGRIQRARRAFCEAVRRAVR